MPDRMGEGEVLISVRTEGVKAAQAALDRLTQNENRRSEATRRDAREETRASQEALANEQKRGAAATKRIGEERRARQEESKRLKDRIRSEERLRRQARRGLQTFSAPARGLGSAFLSVGVFGLAAGTVGAIGLLAAEAVQLSDDLFLAENRLRTFALAGEDVETSLERVTEIAAENGAQIIATTKLYNAFQQTLQNIGGTAQDAIRDTSTFLRLLRISGVTATESGASTQQFIQGFRADRFAGDELRSLLENVGFFGFLLRRHFPGENIRDLGAEGLITRDVVQEVFRQNQETIDRLAAAIELSLGQLATNLQSQFGISSFDAFRDSGLTDELRGFLTDLTDVLASEEVRMAMTDFASVMANIVSLLRSDFVPNIVTIIENLENVIIAFEAALAVFGIGSLASSLRSFQCGTSGVGAWWTIVGCGSRSRTICQRIDRPRKPRQIRSWNWWAVKRGITPRWCGTLSKGSRCCQGASGATAK